MSAKERLTCPFCPFGDHRELFLLQHVENVHPENEESCFTAKGSTRQELYENSQSGQGKSDEDDYIECMCGEFCPSKDFDNHLEMHSAEGSDFDDFGNAMIEDVPTLLHDRGDTGSSDSDTPPRTPTREGLCHYNNPKSTNNFIDVDASSTRRQDDRGYGEVRRLSTSPTRCHSSKTLTLSKRPNPQRLGKAELGPHADEEQMPEWLRKLLAKGARVTISHKIGRDGRLLRIESVANEFRRVMPVISQLCSQDSAVTRAYLCHPNVTHVVKMNKEGGFCGYRNIQMMISYIQDTNSQGYKSFLGRIPSILQLQDMIESAWDHGFCTTARFETGGIRGTRKYIGTPEAQALFESLKISCRAETFHSHGKVAPHQGLLLAVEKYFCSGTTDTSKKVCRTSLPPIYFQHPGHSLTIVGFERRRSGSCNLLVFDPMFQPSPAIRRLLGARFRHPDPEKMLKAYRRGESALRKYKTFEMLHLLSPAASETGWDRIRWSEGN